jgi:hypothetical protein
MTRTTFFYDRPACPLKGLRDTIQCSRGTASPSTGNVTRGLMAERVMCIADLDDALTFD